jgi:hypothetical protein
MTERTWITPLVFDRRGLLYAAIGAILPALKAGPASAAEEVGSVQEVKGDAFAEADGRRRNLERAAPLFLKDMVGTGPEGRLVLHLGSATTLQLGSSARLTIDRFLVNVGGNISLQSGPILFDRPEDAAPVDMQFHSSFGLIAVRGTRFFAGPSAGVFGVFVARGAVAVSAAGTEVLVRAGEGTNIAQPGVAPSAPTPWGAERIRNAMQSVQ